ncbi:hypothetical protein [Polyangium sorediatum]|uniref:HEAT repeat domain-containing protein n=1 Tax=Polyangium sorediatum TaxID=889274 RepID=A0ABT6NSZ7_9BACT|nr:hypothetical protein [Polyangium sorediatum]MDI1431449.1 hypothetical protein [Polyangium sorediatum]
MSLTKATLLAEIEPLTHNERIRRVIEVGRKAAQGDTDARTTLDELHQSPEIYERVLGLWSVFGSRDAARVVAGLSDASRTVRRRASCMVGVFCDDTLVTRALDVIVEKRILYRTLAGLVQKRRSAPVDAFLGAHLKEGEERLVIDLLPLGTETFVSGLMKRLVDGGGPVAWRRLCSRHARFAAAWFLADLERSQTVDPRQRHRLFAELPGLARRAPDTTLKLMQALFDRGEQPSQLAQALGALVRARPRETFDLLKARHESGRPTHAPGAFGVVRFDKVAKHLGAERLDYLLRHAWSTLGDGKQGLRWFLRLSTDDQKAVLRAFLQGGRGAFGAFLFRYFKAESAEEEKVREKAFDRWSRAAQASNGTIPVQVLDWLPRDLREREAKRHLEWCPALTSKPEQRIVYAGLLSFAEAKQVLAPWLGHPEGEERARAQSILLSSIRHDKPALGDAIANIKARKFEQDPVRRSMLEALGALRVATFGPEHLDAVGAVLQDALDAADLSPATASAVERLVVLLFRVDGEWGAQWLTRLFAARGSVSTWGLGTGLTREDAERLSPALAQLAAAWATQERAGAIISLAQSLGVRLGAVTPLLDALEKLARELPFAGVSAAALGLLDEHDRRRFTRLVPELLRDDESFVLLPAVARYVSLRRQDLLSPALLSAQPMKGRFATGRTSWLIPFEVGHGRWTANQQRTYADALVSILKDEARDVPTLRFALGALVRLAFADATSILPFASDPRQPVREMAIRGLPWLDARQGVPVLIEALGDARARWAIYALRKFFSELRREEVLAELRAVPTNKVTVAKEVVRLLGELGGDDAYQELLRLDKPGTHRDVRIALLRALWDHLEKAETWAIFEKAVQDPDWIVASKLADIPLGRLSTEAEERVVALLSTILGRAEPEARIDLLKRAAYLPLRDSQRSLFQRLLVHLGAASHDEAAHALAAVLQRMTTSEVSAVSGRLKELLPLGQHLLAFLPVIRSHLGAYAPAMHVRVATELVAALAENPWTAPHYISLGARLWDAKELSAALIELSKKDWLYHEVLEAAFDVVRGSVHPGRVEVALREQSDGRLRRIALAALVQAASPKNGWTDECRARLGEYQKDPAPGVAGPAHFVFPP